MRRSFVVLAFQAGLQSVTSGQSLVSYGASGNSSKSRCDVDGQRRIGDRFTS